MDENVLDKGTENAADPVTDPVEKAESNVNDTVEKAENAAEQTDKDPFGRIDFGKPLYQAAPPASETTPQALGPMPVAGAETPQQSGPSQPLGTGPQQSGPSQPLGGGTQMSGPSQPFGDGPQMGGPSQSFGDGPQMGQGMNPAGGPMMTPGGPMQGGPMMNGDGGFSPYGGPASQFGGAVPQPVDPVNFGGSYNQGGPQFQQGMGYQQVPPYQQPMGDMYYGYPDPYMQMQQNNGSMGLGIASMVLGILALVTCCCWYISGPLAAISLILGIIGIKSEAGKGMAIAGVVCSGVAILILIAITAYSCYTYGTAINTFQNIMNIP